MDQNTNQTPIQPPITNIPTMPADHKEKKVGPIVAALIIVLVLIIAALYIFVSKMNKSDVPADSALTTNTQSIQATATFGTASQNTPEDIDSIQNDLNGSTAGLDDSNF